MWKIVFTQQAQKDAARIRQAGLKDKTEKILDILANNPFLPPYEKLIGDLKGAYSRRISLQHRVIYEIIEAEHIIKVIRMWTHYE